MAYDHTTFISKGAYLWPVKTISDSDSPYDASLTVDRVILVNTTGGAVTINLNSGDVTFQGVVFLIKDIGGNASTNNITINVGTGETINGNSEGGEITADWESTALYKPSRGSTNWISLTTG